MSLFSFIKNLFKSNTKLDTKVEFANALADLNIEKIEELKSSIVEDLKEEKPKKKTTLKKKKVIDNTEVVDKPKKTRKSKKD